MEPLILALTKLSLLLGVLAAQAAEVPTIVLPPINATCERLGAIPGILAGNGRIRDCIVATARDFGVNETLMLDLAEVESRFDPQAKNPNSTAKGVYQWLDSSWKALCSGDVLNPADNIYCAVKTVSEGGISHWLADPNTVQKLQERGWNKTRLKNDIRTLQ